MIGWLVALPWNKIKKGVEYLWNARSSVPKVRDAYKEGSAASKISTQTEADRRLAEERAQSKAAGDELAQAIEDAKKKQL